MHLHDFTVFENYSKCRIQQKLQFFHSPKWAIFGIFNKLLYSQNVNVSRFDRKVECDFLSDFQTLWILCFNFMSTLVKLDTFGQVSSRDQ